MLNTFWNGYSIVLFDGPIHSVSKKEPRVGTSTTHSEFMAQGEAIKTTLFTQNLVQEMGFPELVDKPTKLQGDNWQATTLLPDQRLTERNRFFVSDYFFAKEACDLDYVLPVWVETINNGADIYTKAVPAQILDRLARPRQALWSCAATAHGT